MHANWRNHLGMPCMACPWVCAHRCRRLCACVHMHLWARIHVCVYNIKPRMKSRATQSCPYGHPLRRAYLAMLSLVPMGNWNNDKCFRRCIVFPEPSSKQGLILVQATPIIPQEPRSCSAIEGAAASNSDIQERVWLGACQASGAATYNSVLVHHSITICASCQIML